MGKTYVIIPREGVYRSQLVFLAEDLDMPKSFRFEEGTLSEFTVMQAMHNGAWRMFNQMMAFSVRVVGQDDGSVEDKLMLVDTVFGPTKVGFVPLEMEGEGHEERPAGAEILVTAADLAGAYGNDYFWENIEEWEAEEYAAAEIIRALTGALMSGDSPWKGALFTHRQEVCKEPNAMTGPTLIAEHWTFLDGSTRYLTQHGVQTEDDFQDFLASLDVQIIEAESGEYSLVPRMLH